MPQPDFKRTAIGLAILLAVFGTGLLKLFLMRFEAGDVYPPYSTLRSDPLGVKALFAALERIPGISVERHFRPLKKARPDGRTTYFYLGADAEAFKWNRRRYRLFLQSLYREGGRLVLSCYPEALTRPSDKKSPSPEEEATNGMPDKKKKKGYRINPGKPAPARIGLGEYLGVEAESASGRLKVGTAMLADDFEKTVLPGASPLPNRIPWHSALTFKVEHPDWRTVYKSPYGPVVLTRPWGKGRIFLLGDSYLFSNEALRETPQPGLLVWLMGDAAHAVFDEGHLGIYQTPGMADLLVQYRLYLLLPGLILVAVLLIWKNAVPFAPLPKELTSQGTNTYTSNRDYTQGVVSLLRRHIAAGDILKACHEEWRKSVSSRQRISQTTMDRIAGLVHQSPPPDTGKSPDPAAIYRTISHLLSERKNS